MKKHFLKYILFIIVFLILPINVSASFGDLRYEITSVGVSGSKITFNGWAFIHRTSNYDTVTYNGNTVASNGGQKILMRAVNAETGELISDTAIIVKNGNDNINYNFYCELFDTSCHKYSNGECVEKRSCNKYNYAALSGAQIKNKCTNRDNGNGDSTINGYCYYEDINFSISFDVSEWNVGSNTKISFQIAASNNDFENKLNNPGGNSYYINYKNNNKYIEYNGDLYTKPENIYIHESLIVGSAISDFIEIDKDTLSEKVAVIAKDSMLRYYNSENKLVYFKDYMFDHHVYSTYPGADHGCTYGNSFLLADTISNYDGGISNEPEMGLCKDFLGGSSCSGSHNYAIYVENINKWYVCPSGVKDGFVAIVRGSHVKVTGETVFQINVKNKKVCEIDNPKENGAPLVCNESKTLNSTCEELSVDTDKGRATVKIEQKGTISSVLTPDKIFAGGGFNFGVMYYNTIKWSYVGSRPNDELHNAVVIEMNEKLKSYDNYVAGLNITELKLGDKKFSTYDGSFLNKMCVTSDRNNNYYDKELTVSCVFSFPESILYPDGTVKYNTGVGSFNINNKYYTNINYDSNYDKYKLEANIVGMDRITEDAAENDSAKRGESWTGDWSDTFTNCEIDLYPLFMKDSRYNFIYRPIDISNPFPNRNAGINWYDWYNNDYNKSLLENTYSDLEYTVVLENQLISEIKGYNKELNNSGGYLNWDSIDADGKSSFVDEYVTREEGVR